MLLRTCSPALALALDSGIPLWQANLFTFTLIDGTVLRYTDWSRDLTVSGQTYISQKPWIKRSKWSLTKTMQVPSMTVEMLALNDGFNGGVNIKLQTHNGLFDGATFVLDRAYMPSPNDVTTLGTITIFGGVTGAATVVGNKVTLTCKGKNNLLDQNAPRNIFQAGCLHAFCDAECTLNRASFTFPYAVGVSPSTIFIPWASPPANPALYVKGSVHITSGPASGQWREIDAADSTGILLSYPLYQTPLAGDTFDGFQGCDKTFDSGSGQSCTDYANTDNYFGFPFMPPPTSSM